VHHNPSLLIRVKISAYQHTDEKRTEVLSLIYFSPSPFRTKLIDPKRRSRQTQVELFFSPSESIFLFVFFFSLTRSNSLRRSGSLFYFLSPPLDVFNLSPFSVGEFPSPPQFLFSIWAHFVEID
jgi:hypothetical protein